MIRAFYNPCFAKYAVAFIISVYISSCADDNDSSSDSTNYMSQDHISLATEIALRYIDKHPPDDLQEMRWDWSQGVLMHSLVELYRATEDSRLRNYYKTWLDAHIEKGYSISWSDSCPPALTALALYQETGEQKYQQVIDDVMKYLYEVAKRADNGAICHLGRMTPTVWVDSLFMFGAILTRYGEASGDTKYLDTIGEQFVLFAELLQDSSGLFRHAYNWTASTETDIFWARGNGWAVASGFDYLRARRGRSETDTAVESIIMKQASTLIELQDSDTGLFWNILNRPGEIYLETSGSALITYGLAQGYTHKYLDDTVLPAIQKALKGIKSKIVADDEDRPIVTGMSGQTSAGNFDNYAEVPLVDDEDFGVGAVILALLATSQLN